MNSDPSLTADLSFQTAEWKTKPLNLWIKKKQLTHDAPGSLDGLGVLLCRQDACVI